MLFGISTYLVATINTQFGLFSSSGMEQNVAMGLKIGPDFLVEFAIVSLVVTSFFGGLIIGVVKNGDEKAGIKFIPMLLITSLIIFFVVRTAVASIFPALS